MRTSTSQAIATLGDLVLGAVLKKRVVSVGCSVVIASYTAVAGLVVDDPFNMSSDWSTPGYYKFGVSVCWNGGGANPAIPGFSGAWYSEPTINQRRKWTTHDTGLVWDKRGTVKTVGGTTPGGGAGEGYIAADDSGQLPLIARNFNTSTDTESSLWFRWLWDPNANATQGEFLNIYVGDGAGRISAQVIGDANNIRVALFDHASGSVFGSGVATEAGVNLIVINVVIDRSAGADDTVRMWVNPSDYHKMANLQDPASTQSENVFEDAAELTKLNLGFYSDGGKFDEFAVGTELSDIIDPPTPKGTIIVIW